MDTTHRAPGTSVNWRLQFSQEVAFHIARLSLKGGEKIVWKCVKGRCMSLKWQANRETQLGNSNKHMDHCHHTDQYRAFAGKVQN